MNASTNTEVEKSAALDGAVTPAGRFPRRTNTVAADVLMRLLSGSRLTTMDSVYSSSTTRLAARVEYLARKYGWFIPREDKAHACSDGRVSTVAVYYLLPSTTADAKQKGAAAWCAAVHAARLKLRAEATEAIRKADAINAARRKTKDERQGDLFGGAAA